MADHTIDCRAVDEHIHQAKQARNNTAPGEEIKLKWQESQIEEVDQTKFWPVQTASIVKLPLSSYEKNCSDLRS